MLVSDTDLDKRLPRGSHQEAWDTGAVLVKRAPRVLVVVEKGQDAARDQLVAMARSAVKAVTKSWPGGWNGSGVVIALDDKVVRGADYTQPKNAEDALAMATWVYRTLPGEVTGEGQRADSYVVVNPRNRNKVDARTLAHEFTHVATAPYGAYAPRWLVEGAATYVEFLPMDGQTDLAMAQVPAGRADEVPGKAKSLPADAVVLPPVRQLVPVVLAGLDYLFSGSAGPRSARCTRSWPPSARPRTNATGSCSNTSGITEAGPLPGTEGGAAAACRRWTRESSRVAGLRRRVLGGNDPK